VRSANRVATKRIVFLPRQLSPAPQSAAIIGGMNDRKWRVLSACLIASCASSASLVAVIFFKWVIVDVVTPFLLGPVLAACWGIFALFTLWPIVHGIRRRSAGARAFLPLAIVLVAALTGAFAPLTAAWLRLDFHLHRSERELMVQRIKDGALRPNVDYNPSLLALGPDAPHVSRGGNELIVEEHGGKKYVFFYTFRGVLDNYSGFLFVPSGGNPSVFSDLAEPSTQIKHLEDNWYFTAHR
jgi:hypothetical protein